MTKIHVAAISGEVDDLDRDVAIVCADFGVIDLSRGISPNHTQEIGECRV
jgi:hypothetical protein